MSEGKRTAHKVTLSSGRVIVLLTPKQSDLNEATKESGLKAGTDNQAYFGLTLQRCLTSRILHSIDGEELSIVQKADPDLFTIQENAEVSQYVGKMTGLDLGNEVTSEVVTI